MYKTKNCLQAYQLDRIDFTLPAMRNKGNFIAMLRLAAKNKPLCMNIYHLVQRTLKYRIAVIFRGGKIFVDMENFAGSWKQFRGFVYACTNERGSLHL